MGVDAVSLEYPNGPSKGYENKIMSLDLEIEIAFFLSRVLICMIGIKTDLQLFVRTAYFAHRLKAHWADFGNLSLSKCFLNMKPNGSSIQKPTSPKPNPTN